MTQQDSAINEYLFSTWNVLDAMLLAEDRRKYTCGWNQGRFPNVTLEMS